MILLLIGAAAAAAAWLGGMLAFRFQDRLHLVLGFSAGAVLGVAFFDLMPEAIELSGGESATTFSVIFLAFLIYMLLDRSVLLHQHSGDDCHSDHHAVSSARGRFGALSLALHSFLDGAAVGLAFQAAPTLGATVAAAVLAHSFSDGINTVSVVKRHGGGRREAYRWLLLDAVAPFLGVVSTFFFILPVASLGFVFSVFAGFFIYLGASDLLPESHHRHSTYLTSVATFLGAGLVLIIGRLLGA